MIDKNRIEKAVREILFAIGENPDREGLIETPERVARMYEEIFSGLSIDPMQIIKIFHEDNLDEMVVLKDIPFYSMCEHHLMPFYGNAHVVYIPQNGKILGLSKIARIVEAISRKPQIQERMTQEICNVIMQAVEPLGAAVFIEAEHLCMTMRGVKKPGAKTVTTNFAGIMKTDRSIKAEAISLMTK
jgi:GTP cyclohydrolase I